jgi:neurofibromin 1
MYLWSIDLEAVLVSMSCFSLLCEEADIRCGSDEMTANFILPNYHVYEVINCLYLSHVFWFRFNKNA